MNWYIKVLKQYADFEGRARRMEYWVFVLCNVAISCMISFLDIILGTIFNYSPFIIDGTGILAIIYSLAVLLPSIAVLVRRLHDTGRSGYWILLSFIPLIGGIILIIFLCLPSEEGENEWGPDPFEEGLPHLDVNKFDEL